MFSDNADKISIIVDSHIRAKVYKYLKKCGGYIIYFIKIYNVVKEVLFVYMHLNIERILLYAYCKIFVF
jgi:hypothetical protein